MTSGGLPGDGPTAARGTHNAYGPSCLAHPSGCAGARRVHDGRLYAHRLRAAGGERAIRAGACDRARSRTGRPHPGWRVAGIDLGVGARFRRATRFRARDVDRSDGWRLAAGDRPPVCASGGDEHRGSHDVHLYRPRRGGGHDSSDAGHRGCDAAHWRRARACAPHRGHPTRPAATAPPPWFRVAPAGFQICE
jgi:hypothetical protein